MIKTAGLTFHYILRNNYGINYVRIRKENFIPADLKALISLNKNIKAISGHGLRSIIKLDSISPDLEYITFLRDPIRRYLSHFNHAKLRNIFESSLDDFVTVLSESDYQTKFVLGAQNDEDRNFKAGKKDLEEAKKILANDFAFVGIVEQFDESLISMRKKLNIHNFDLRYQMINVASRNIVKKDDLSHDLMGKIKRANEIDHELYLFAREELLEREKSKYGDMFVEDLEDFKQRNESYKFKKSKIILSRIGQYLVYEPLLRFKRLSH